MFSRVLLLVSLCAAGAFATPFIIGLDENYPPWAAETFVDGVPSGVSVKMIQRICMAQAMDCEVVWVPSADCLNDQGVGDALRNHQVDACLDWSSTQGRQDMGLAFSNDYSTGPSRALITDPGRTPKSFSNLVNIGYVNGFVASPQQCEGLTPAMHNNLKNYVPFDTSDIETMLAQLDSGVLDYVLWDGALPTLPTSGWTAVAVVQDGGDSTSIVCTDDGLALMTYPTNSNYNRVQLLLINFNQGLNTIRRTEYYSTLCYGTCPPANCIQEWQPASSASGLGVACAALFSAVAAYFFL